MSTYYKDTLSGAPIYRIAAARVTFEKADGSIGELNLTGGGGGGAGSWADVEAFSDFPVVMAYGPDIETARNAIGAAAVEDIPDWSTLSGKPATFPPVVGTGATDAKAGNYVPTWTEVTGKPAFIGAGTTAALARTAITAAASGANSDITSLTALSTPLSAAQGGTGTTSLPLLGTGLNIEMFSSGIAPTISNVDTWTTGGFRALTTTTVGRPTGTANGDVILNIVSATNAAQIALLMTSGKLVYRVFTTSWQAWQDVTHTALT